jgi:hypothetical protein
MQRLSLLADEIAFTDYPAVKFGNWGMVGHDSVFRDVLSEDDDPCRITAHGAPEGPAGKLVLPYVESDLRNLEFQLTFLDGLRNAKFASKFIQAQADYGGGIKGQQVVEALVADGSLRQKPVGMLWDVKRPGEMFSVGSEQERQDVLAKSLMTASVLVTTALAASESSGCVPVSDEPYFAKLVALRTGTSPYVGNTARITPYLGLEIIRSVVPESMLARLRPQDIFEYRRKTREVYGAWNAEVNALGARLDELAPDELARRLPKLLATEIEPKIIAYRNEMRSVRDALWADLIKEVVKWEFPSVGLAHMTGASIPLSLVAFAAGVRAAIPAVVDYYRTRSEVGRRHAVSYVVGLADARGSDDDTPSGQLRAEF